MNQTETKSAETDRFVCRACGARHWYFAKVCQGCGRVGTLRLEELSHESIDAGAAIEGGAVKQRVEGTK